MKKALFGLVLAAFMSSPVFAQQEATVAAVKRFVPYASLLGKIPGLTLDEYNTAVRELVRQEEGRLSGLVVSDTGISGPPTPASVQTDEAPAPLVSHPLPGSRELDFLLPPHSPRTNR